MLGSAGCPGFGQDLPRSCVTARCLETSGPARAPAPRPRPLAPHQLPRPGGLLHTLLEAGRSHLANEKFASKCEFSRLTPIQDFQLILLDSFSWRIFHFGVRGTERPWEVGGSASWSPRLGVWGIPRDPGDPFSSPSFVSYGRAR